MKHDEPMHKMAAELLAGSRTKPLVRG